MSIIEKIFSKIIIFLKKYSKMNGHHSRHQQRRGARLKSFKKI